VSRFGLVAGGGGDAVRRLAGVVAAGLAGCAGMR